MAASPRAAGSPGCASGSASAAASWRPAVTRAAGSASGPGCRPARARRRSGSAPMPVEPEPAGPAPADPGPADTGPADTGPANTGRGGTSPIRVLVCDDQSVVRYGYMTILAAQPDIEVVGEAGNGAVAVTEAQRLRPDVVVM